MPPARVQTGQTNRPASARAESARNSSSRKLSARPASAKVRSLSGRSINSATSRGKVRPNDIGDGSRTSDRNMRPNGATQLNATADSGTSPQRQGTAWTVPSSEELRGRSSIGEESNLPGTRATTAAAKEGSPVGFSARKESMFRSTGDLRMPQSNRSSPMSPKPALAQPTALPATEPVVSRPGERGKTRSPGYMAPKGKVKQRQQATEAVAGPETAATNDDERKDFLKNIVMHRDLGDLLTMVQADKKKNKKQKKKQDPSESRYRRPEPSRKIPLRSMFLDPVSCNFQPSTTRKSLMRKIREVNLPHQSYDIDGDGIVSQEDLFCAKRFDVNNDGVLDENEVNVGRLVIAEDFFRNHKDKAGHYFGPEYAALSVEESVEAICKNYSLDGIVRKLQSVEQDIGLTSSQQMRNLLHYQTKSDLTRPDPTSFSSSVSATDTHNGSRAALFAVRRAQDRSRCQRLLNKSYETSMYGTMGGTTGSSDVTRPKDPKLLPWSETPRDLLKSI